MRNIKNKYKTQIHNLQIRELKTTNFNKVQGYKNKRGALTSSYFMPVDICEKTAQERLPTEDWNEVRKPASKRPKNCGSEKLSCIYPRGSYIFSKQIMPMFLRQFFD